MRQDQYLATHVGRPKRPLFDPSGLMCKTAPGASGSTRCNQCRRCALRGKWPPDAAQATQDPSEQATPCRSSAAHKPSYPMTTRVRSCRCLLRRVFGRRSSMRHGSSPAASGSGRTREGGRRRSWGPTVHKRDRYHRVSGDIKRGQGRTVRTWIPRTAKVVCGGGEGGRSGGGISSSSF